MFTDGRIMDQNFLNALRRTFAVSAGGVAEGTNDHTLKTTATITFCINGVAYSKTAADNIACTVCAEQAASLRCRYLVLLNAAGTVSVLKGTAVRSYSYTAATLAWENPKKMTDTAKGLGGFRTGEMILVESFTEPDNNGIFHIDYVASDGSYIMVRENRAVPEALGDTVTITVEAKLPEVPYGLCPVSILTVVTGTTAFIVGTDDMTGDIGTGSVAFSDIFTVPAEAD
jgi:hypothetical protein